MIRTKYYIRKRESITNLFLHPNKMYFSLSNKEIYIKL